MMRKKHTQSLSSWSLQCHRINFKKPQKEIVKLKLTNTLKETKTEEDVIPGFCSIRVLVCVPEIIYKLLHCCFLFICMYKFSEKSFCYRCHSIT